MKSIQLTSISGDRIIVNPVNYNFVERGDNVLLVNVRSYSRLEVKENFEEVKQKLQIR